MVPAVWITPKHVIFARKFASFSGTTTEIPENLAYYIDYEKMGRDMELSGDIFTIETGYQEVHIFWSQ